MLPGKVSDTRQRVFVLRADIDASGGKAGGGLSLVTRATLNPRSEEERPL